MARLLSVSAVEGQTMAWNAQPIPHALALRIGWNLPADVVGAGVYGGVAKRDAAGRIIVGDEWPEDNLAPPAHNPVHSTGPYLDFSRFSEETMGYTQIARTIIKGSVLKLDALLESVKDEADRRKLANLVMAGGARPLHMCGMSRGGDASEMIEALIKHGADVNAKDNYEMTPMDRLSSNSVGGNALLRKHGARSGRQLPRGVPRWDADEFLYQGVGEV